MIDDKKKAPEQQKQQDGQAYQQEDSPQPGNQYEQTENTVPTEEENR